MRLSKRSLAIGLLSLVALLAPAQTLEFIHLSDTHVADLESVTPQLAAARNHYGGGGATLAAFLEQHRPAFYVITGDVTDAFRYTGKDGMAVYGQIERFITAAARSAAPLYLALGNHDIQHYGLNANGKAAADQTVAGEARAAWVAAAPCFRKGTWYSFTRELGGTKYVFVVLDDGFSGGKTAREQRGWLKRQVEEAAGAPMILALHIPLNNDADAQEVKDALDGANVPLVLAGHNHTAAVAELKLGSGTAVQTRTGAFGASVNNWRQIRLHPDRI
jgi:3',5'-cyclic AMP phosphodiesterase CpdA